MTGKAAILVGATGLVGTELLGLLLKSQVYDKIVCFTRRPLSVKHHKLHNVVLDFSEMKYHENLFKVDDVFCCLGTTIKKAKTKEAMYKIDVEYPVEIAEYSKKNGVKNFVIISSMGANSNSTIWYSRMKGILEEKLKGIGMSSLFIVRPSLLLGDRTEFRLGECIGTQLSKAISFLFVGPLKKYRPIRARNVAVTMLLLAQQVNKGVRILESDELMKIPYMVNEKPI
jgi:uncharacterized protein YbjT (DUF2867 family)